MIYILSAVVGGLLVFIGVVAGAGLSNAKHTTTAKEAEEK